MLAAAGAVSACAGGAPGNGGPIATGVGSAPGPVSTADDDDDGGTASSSTGENDDDEDDDAPPDDTEEPPAESSSADMSASTTDEPAGESSSDSGDDTANPTCPNEASCDNGRVIGMVSGDESSPGLDIGGTEPTWLTFQVTEDNDSVVGEALRFTATLNSPPGVDFDLYVYRGAPNGPTGCGGVMDSSTSNGASDLVHMSWGEGGVANGGDDRSWVAVEIVVKNDACSDGSAWSLSVEGAD